MSTSELTPRQFSALAKELFHGAPLGMRLLQQYRPYICPFELLAPHIPEGASVLDVGCGGGLFLGLLAALGKKIQGVGVDFSRPAIAAAREMGERVNAGPLGSHLEFRLTHANDPLPEGPFDAVVVIDVMHHVPQAGQHAFFEALASRVAPGGLLIYKDIVDESLWQVAGSRFHDLVMARQWIHEVPMETVAAWAASANLTPVAPAKYARRFWYGHEFTVFRRPHHSLKDHPHK